MLDPATPALVSLDQDGHNGQFGGGGGGGGVYTFGSTGGDGGGGGGGYHLLAHLDQVPVTSTKPNI